MGFLFWYNYFNDQTLNFYIRGGVMKEVLYFYSPGCPFCKKADKFIAQAIEENPKAVDDYLAGQKASLNFLVGQVMRITRGKADPGETVKLLRENIE